MPTLKPGDIIANVPQQISTLPRLLGDLDLPVPAALSDGLTKARWRVPGPDLEARKTAVLAAGTHDEFAAGVVAYAESLTALRAMGSGGEIAEVLKHFAYDAAISGLVASKAEILDSIGDAFVRTGDDFTETLSRVPADMILDVRHEDFNYELIEPMRDAKRLAARLTAIIEAFNNVMLSTANTAAMVRINEPGYVVKDIAVFESPAHEAQAAHDIERYAVNMMQGVDSELLPWAPIVRANGRFVAPSVDTDWYLTDDDEPDA